MDTLSGIGSISCSEIDRNIENLLIILNFVGSKKSDLTKSKKSKSKKLDLTKTNFVRINSYQIDFLTSKSKKAFIYL